MPILSAGTNVTLTLVDYSTVYVECKNTSVQVDAVSGLGLSAGRIAEIGSPTVFGPYVSGSVKLTATSRDIYYEQQAGVRSIAVGGGSFDQSAVAITGGTIGGVTVAAVATTSTSTSTILNSYLTLNIAGNGEAPGGLNGTNGKNRAFCRAPFPVRKASSSISFFLTNIVDTATYPIQTILGAAIELNGVTYPCTFSGAAGATMAVGQAQLVADFLPLSVKAGDVVYIRVLYDTTTSAGVLGSGRAVTNGTTYSYDSVNENNQLLLTGVPTTPTGAQGMFQSSPVMLLGKVPPDSIAVFGIGDSIMDGAHDMTTSSDGNNSSGVGRNAAHIAGLPYCSQAVSGRPLSSASATTNQLTAIAQYHTHCWHQLGTNDLASTNYAGMVMNYATVWAKLKANLVGRKYVGQLTICPRVSTTDGTTTLANQTPIAGFGSSQLRDQLHFFFNASCQNGLLDQVLDSAAAVQSPSDPSKWALRPFSTTFAAAYTSGTTASVNAIPEFGEELIANAAVTPTSGITLVRSYAGTAAPFTLTLTQQFNLAQASGATINATYSIDGTHPGRIGTRVLATKLLADFQARR
jgi:lysophospholipase L1-like esterase